MSDIMQCDVDGVKVTKDFREFSTTLFNYNPYDVVVRFNVPGFFCERIIEQSCGLDLYGINPSEVFLVSVKKDQPESPPPPQWWATVGDVIDELSKHDREKRFQIRDWPRYFDLLEDIDVQPGDLQFRETDDAVIWDVWEML